MSRDNENCSRSASTRSLRSVRLQHFIRTLLWSILSFAFNVLLTLKPHSAPGIIHCAVADNWSNFHNYPWRNAFPSTVLRQHIFRLLRARALRACIARWSSRFIVIANRLRPIRWHYYTFVHSADARASRSIWWTRREWPRIINVKWERAGNTTTGKQPSSLCPANDDAVGTYTKTKTFPFPN